MSDRTTTAPRYSSVPIVPRRSAEIVAPPAGDEARNLEDPNHPITTSELCDLYAEVGAAESGVYVTGETAMRVATVFACVRIISQAVASVGREINEIDADGVARAVTSGATLRALTVEPNEYMSAFDFFVMMQAHAELWGNGYAAIERNGRGEAVNLLPLISRRVAPERINGRLFYRVALMDTAGALVLPASEVLHIRGVMLDGLVGLAPINQGRQTIGLTEAAERYGSRFFKNDARPSIVLKHEKTLSEGAARRLKADWLARYSGTSQHSPAVLEEGLSFETVGIEPNAAQFLETRRFQRQDIAALFGVPLSMLADPDAKSYRSGEDDDRRFTKHSILPRTKAWEGEFNRKLFPGRGRRVAHDLSELVRGTLKDHIGALKDGVQNALMTPNEARKRLGLPPITGGDQLFLQQNMAGVDAIANGTAGNKVQNAAGADPKAPKPADEAAEDEDSDNDDEE
jgi:HK97 family phage portal protein